MPDLLTHTLFVYPLKNKYRRGISIILLGAVLPDLFSRIPGIIIPNQTLINWAQQALHTPVALIFLCLLLSFFFPEKIRKSIFLFLALGVFSHLFLDLFQKTLTYGYFWFFPFSFISFNIPLFWPNDSVFLIPLFVILNIFCFTLLRNSNED